VADATRTYVTTRVGIGTTTPSSSYLLQVTNDSDTGVTIGSGGSMTAKTLAVTGTATVTGTLTAGNALRVDTRTLVVDATNDRVGIGTTTPQYTLQVNDGSGALGFVVDSTGSVTATGTITAANFKAVGTITAAGFIGDGSQLTNVPAGSPGANTVDSSQLVNTLNITDTTINVGSLTVSAGNFRVDSAGSMTATTITTTGSTTASGTLTAANSTFRADAAYTYVTTRVGIGTTTPSSSYLLQVTNDSDTGVTIGSGGSMTAKTLAVTGTATVTGTLTASNALRVNTSTLVVDATNSRVGIGTTTPATLFTVGTTTNILNITDAGKVGVGTTTPGTALYVIGTITATGEIISRNNGLVVKLEPPPMGEIYFTNNATSTTIASAGVFVKVAGATTFDPNSMQFDTGTTTTDNRLRYTGTATKAFHVAMTASWTCANAKVVALAIAKNGTTTGMEKSIIKDTSSSGTDVESSAIHVMPVLNQNDYLEVFVTNITDTTAVTLQTLNMFGMGMSQGTD